MQEYPYTKTLEDTEPRPYPWNVPQGVHTLLMHLRPRVLQRILRGVDECTRSSCTGGKRDAPRSGERSRPVPGSAAATPSQNPARTLPAGFFGFLFGKKPVPYAGREFRAGCGACG